MTEGLVSIITTLFDTGDYIARTIESVLAQTYTNWEMVITDDCSKDDGPAIVESYAAKDPRIRLIRLDENGGPGIARNRSIENARGQYIAFLDSDDTWLPDKLEKQIALMKEKGCGMVYSSYYTCDEDDHITGLVKCRRRIPYWRIVCDNAVGFLTMMYDASMTGVELLPELRKRQDWGLNIKIIKKCRIAYGVQKPLAMYRIRQGSVSSGKLSLIKYNVGIYHKVLGYTKFRSVLTFTFVFLPVYFSKKVINFFETLFFKQ